MQALLQELIEVVGEKPAIAKRLVEAIRFRLSDVSLDPLVVNKLEGAASLQKKTRKAVNGRS
ncbi:hypothetical protein HYPDE_33333 [Hyphomicrobium denitrificans 1NES1]|uniref:Uncharacterized protein n=1 Tax=Hyphomicrobium denitrificans 1NES1 TaxID=670307 RepID=N0B484_9HYPH|nr:hypothetical protein HYPDE_33333 [Hyphomicrobium denitrificans 1NES1]